jgi:general secretion pathway protein I
MRLRIGDCGLRIGRRADRAPAIRNPQSTIRNGFTLVEVLAALLLIAIVLPAVMRGISTATGMATVTRMRTEAAGLAQAKLGELIATGDWQSGNLSGTFGSDWPDYRWEAASQGWSGDTSGSNLTQVDVRVLFTLRGREEAITLSTMAYARSVQ